MAIGVRVDVDMRRVEIYLREINRRGDRPGPALKRCGPVGMRSIDRNFLESGRPEKWLPVTRTKVRRSREGRASDTVLGESIGAKPLMDTSRLRSSIEFDVEGNDAVWFTELDYAPYHQFGSEGGQPIRPVNGEMLRIPTPDGFVYAEEVTRGDIPARPFMLWQEEDADAFAAIFADYLVPRSAA